MVTFYEIDDANPGVPGKPVLYLDTLKVSTIEQTAESVDARGGKGNAALVSWDFGKEITISLEDALYSAKSLALQFGDVDGADGTAATITKTLWKEQMDDATSATINGTKITLTSPKYYKADGTDGSETEYAYVTGSFTASASYTIDVSANSFPGTLAA